MPTLHLPCPSPSYTVYFLSVTLWGGELSTDVCCQLGYIWGLRWGTIPGGSSHSPAFADAHKEQVAVTTPATSFCSLLFSLSHSLQLGFKLGIGKQF